ncbi:MAG: hypothetical protein ACT4OJ_07240 [Bacteroidota bacterium]
MKKNIILIAFSMSLALMSNAQSSNMPTAIGGDKVMTAEEANRLNGVAQPTINGKPYSQYKAEQEALKKQRLQQQKQAAAAPEGGLVLSSDKGVNTTVATAGKPVEFRTQAVPAATDQKPVIAEQAPVFISEMLKAPANPLPPAATEPKTNQPVINENTKPAEKDKPQVPEQFRLPANASWGNATPAEMPVRNNVMPPQIKTGDPAQSMNAQVVTDAYKTPAVKGSNNSSGNEGIKADMKPVDAKNITPASVVSADSKKATPAPEVPAQLRLPASQEWNGRAVATETAAAKSNPAQSMDAPVKPDAYKTPVIKDDGESAGDDIKKTDKKPAETKPVQAAITKKETNTATTPEVPAQLRLNTSQSWDGRAVTREAATAAPATEKPVSRSAAEIEAANKAAQQAETEKSKKPVEASKAAVQELRATQQETVSVPKKD